MTDNIKDINEANKIINDLRKQLGFESLKIDLTNIKSANKEIQSLQSSLREMDSELGFIESSFTKMVEDLTKGNYQLSQTRTALKGIVSISSQLSDFRRGDIDLSRRDLENLT